jgi:rhodanese-related sulfurtransferase
MNRAGPKPVNWSLENLPAVTPVAELADPTKYFVVDVRDAQEYAAGHIPNSVNIAVRGRFETWTGIMVPWDANTVLTGSIEEIKETLFRLHRVGYEPKCVVFDTWKQAGLPLTKNQMITPQQLHAKLKTSESPLVVDVRLPSEWMALRIGTVINMPLNELSQRANKLDKRQRVVAVCNSAYRSSLAVGILERQGFEQVSSMAGGGQAWIDAGLPVLEAKASGSVGSVPKREIHLAERTSASELQRLMMDLPGTFEIVDIRPPQHFADYNLPGSVNVDIAELMSNPAYLTGAGSLVIVCRDGSLALMVGGILSQKTQRNIKVLYGGLEAYWNDQGPAASARSTGVPTFPAVAPSSRPASPVPSAAKPASRPRKRSAGC